MESDNIRILSDKDLELFTDGFSEENFIGNFQFGRVYRGKIPQGFSGMEAQEVTVKIYEDTTIDKYQGNYSQRVQEEFCLLRELTHPNVVKSIGFCHKGEVVGAVYDLKPLDTVHNLMCKDNFTWLQRIKVALEFACLLEYFHFPRVFRWPCLVRNVNAAHIMLDKDYNAKLFDLSMTCGGYLDTRNFVQAILGCHGYIDPAFATVGATWSEKNDVFAFGVVLLGLIAKRDPENYRKNIDGTLAHKWAHSEYRPNKSIMRFGQSNRSLVHQSLEAAPEFYSCDGPKITKLAMRCVNYCPLKRPTMKQVVDYLLDLRVVERHADSLGIGQLVRGHDPNPHKENLIEVRKLLSWKTSRVRVHDSSATSPN